MSEKPKYYNQSCNRATQKYIAAKLEEVRFRVKKGEKALLQAEAQQQGQSMAQYIIQSVNDRAGHQMLTPSDALAELAQNRP